MSEQTWSLPDLVAGRAATTPDHVALREVDGPRRSLTWGELELKSADWASAFARLGVGRGDSVLTMMANGCDTLVGWNAISRLGAVEVSVNDAYKGAWLEHVVRLSRARVAVVHDRFIGPFLDLPDDLALDALVVVGSFDPRERRPSRTRVVPLDDILADHLRVVSARVAGNDTAAIVILTSGTTGRSKGVVTPWGYWAHRAVDAYLPPDFLTAADVHYSRGPSFHVGGRDALYRAVYLGGSVVTREKFSASAWLSDLRSEGCTFATLVGAMVQFLLSRPELPDDADNPLRAVVYGPVGPEVDDFQRRFGVDVFTTWGMTECSNPISSWSYEVTKKNYHSCGVAHPQRSVKVVDDKGATVPAGVVGELLVRDDRPEQRMALGYLNNDEATDTSWKEGWFHTGDALKYDEGGRFYFVDRIKDAIRRRGENISSFEVELAVCRYDGVAEAAAFAVPSESSEDEVMLAVVPVAGRNINPADLRSHLERRMPRFALPRYIEVVDDLPRTPTAKVQKELLRQRGVTASTWDYESRTARGQSG